MGIHTDAAARYALKLDETVRIQDGLHAEQGLATQLVAQTNEGDDEVDRLCAARGQIEGEGCES